MTHSFPFEWTGWQSAAGRRTPVGWCAAVALALLVCAASPVRAQEVPDEAPPPPDSTREGRLRQQRQEKAERLVSPEPGFLSRVAVQAQSFIDRNQIVIDVPSLDLYGLRPVLGGLQVGAGTTAGLRLPFFRENDDVQSFVEALASLRSYYGVNGILGYDPPGPWSYYGFGRYWHMPEEDFYGVGPTAGDVRTNYRLNEMVAGGLVGFELLPGVLVGVHGSYQVNRYGRGQDEDFAAVEQRFFELPGLGANVDYAVPGAFLEYDSRNISYDIRYGRRFAPTENRLRGVSLDATRGYYAAFEVLPHLAIGEGDYSFTRFNVEMQEFVPFRSGYQALALRQFLSLTSTQGGNRVPFYEMVALGGARTLRGFNPFRFRDRNAILFNAEYRWNVFRPLDMALFVDAGHVFGPLQDAALKAGDLEVDYGLGFRFKSGRRVVGRVDIAYSREGLSTYLSFGGLL